MFEFNTINMKYSTEHSKSVSRIFIPLDPKTFLKPPRNFLKFWISAELSKIQFFPCIDEVWEIASQFSGV